jgi:predicted glycosyltransferase
MAERQPNVQFARYTPDLLPYMRRAALSISMGGYNTIMNILSSGTRAIVFPYTANGDQEQYIRAEKLHALGVVEMIHPGVLEPLRLSCIIRAVLEKKPAARNWRMDGAEESARAISRLLHSRARAVGAMRA